jgi:uncharacterized membrane protein (DUF106 family)
VNKHNNRTAIDRHRDKTNEMLEHNAQFWTEKSAGLVVDDEAGKLRVSFFFFLYTFFFQCGTRKSVHSY